MNKRPIIIIDGLNCFIRFFLVNQTVSAYSEPIGGVVGFLKFIETILFRWSPAKIIVVWENGGGSQRRKKIYPDYKDNRSKLNNIDKGTIKDVLKHDTKNKAKQLSVLYQFLKQTPVCQIFIQDTECDDIIGYIAKYVYQKEDRLKLIFSSDKDFYQLLEDTNVKIFDPAKKTTVDSDYVKTKYNISARNFCLARALVGDVSDNIEGVPGVGLKTVYKRFPDFITEERDLTIDDVLKASKSLLGTKKGQKLKAPKDIIECEQIIRRNWKLMYLNSSNLSAHQIEKINGTLEQHDPAIDKLSLLKSLTKEGINISFDFNNFCNLLKQNLFFD